MVVETPPMALGTFDDMWFQWIIDFGMPGPDRGAGGKFLLVPPGYDGPLPEGGFYVAHSRTNRALMLCRSFLEDNDPAPTVATIKSTLKIYPYTPGWVGDQRRHPPPRRGAVRPGHHRRAGDHVRRGHRHRVQHDPADRRPVLRDRARPAAGRARRRRQPRDRRPPRRARHRQGQAVRPRRADARHPRRGGDGRQRHLAGADVRRPRRGRRLLLPGLGVDQHAVQRRLPVRDDRSRRSPPRGSSRTRPPGPASTTCAPCSSTATPASPRRWPCASPGSAPSTSPPSWTRTRPSSTDPGPTP